MIKGKSCKQLEKNNRFFKRFYLFIYDSHTHREREREAETQAEGEAGSMHREPDVGFDPGSPGSRPGPKAGAKPLRHPGIPTKCSIMKLIIPISRQMVFHHFQEKYSLENMCL